MARTKNLINSRINQPKRDQNYRKNILNDHCPHVFYAFVFGMSFEL